MSVSVIIPCLNEAGSIELCINNIRKAFAHEANLEILVADNNSSDGSPEIAIKSGARVVIETKRGYGAAIMRGLREATGDYLVVGDADNTYDFNDGAKLVEELKKGADFAIGNRLKLADPGSMPPLHRYVGTPVLTSILNKIFGTKVHDINCGLRAIRRSKLPELHLRSSGMEFASEMVIHASKARLRFAELDIRYYKRHAGQAKLRTFRDGWRHLRFILYCAPFMVYFVPALLGVIATAWLMMSPRLGVQVAGILVGLSAFQIFTFGLIAKSILWVSDAFIVDKEFGALMSRFKLEHGLMVSFAMILGGVILVMPFDISSLIRSAFLLTIGVQLFFSSFIISTILSRRSS